MRVHLMRSAVLDAPVAAVWDRIRDFNGHVAWHPAVADSAIEGSDPGDRVGAVRAFTLADGGRFREQLIQLSDRERSLTYCLLEAPLRLDAYVATMSLKPVTDTDRTLLVWEGRFAPPPDQADSLARLVAVSIYEDGLAALQRLFAQGTPRAPMAVVPRAPQPAVPALASASASIGASAFASSGASASDSIGASASASSGAPAPVASIRAQAVVVERYGDPTVLVPRLVDVAPPGPGEVRIAQTAIGVNFIDLHCRAGDFALMPLPGIPGMEAAGTVLDTGVDVDHLAAGDRVVYACEPVGAYAAVRTMAANLVLRLPRDIPDPVAASITLKGLMADILVNDVHRPRAGETILIRTAAGGVGLLLAGMLKALGATLIGVVSNADKAAAASRAGCDHVVGPGTADIAATVARVTAGRGVDAVFDGLGRDTFDPSLDLLARRGHLVSYGQATGPVGARDIDRLAAKSIRISRPSFGHFITQREELEARAARLFGLVRTGTLSLEPVTRLPLAEAAQAHRILETRRNVGALVLIPER